MTTLPEDEILGLATEDTIVDTTLKRKKQVALDESYLLNESKGLPYLLAQAPKRIKMSSKKSSLDNLNSVINFYQLWAHELYPKANFNDFLALCDGSRANTARVRAYRRTIVEKEIHGATVQELAEIGKQLAREPVINPDDVQVDEDEENESRMGLFVDEDDDLYATRQSASTAEVEPNTTLGSELLAETTANDDFDEQEFDEQEFEMDQLLKVPPPINPPTQEEEEDQEQLELMREMGL